MIGKIRKNLIIIASATLLCLIAVGATLAFVFTQTDPVENVFTPSEVSCAVVEGEKDPVFGSVVNMENIKTDVKIKNTGDTDAYIRVAILVNWATDDGTRVWAQKPQRNIDYTMEPTELANGWFDGNDGFYYYQNAIAPGELTGILVKEAKLKDGANIPQGTDGTRYYLSIEIVASAIQSKPASAVTDQWHVTVGSDGTIGK